MVYNLAYRVTLHEEEALDVTQQVFVRLSEKIHLYDGQGCFRSWLSTMAVRMAIDRTRSKSRREIPTSPEIFEDRERVAGREGESHPRAVLERRRTTERVAEAMEKLSAQQRAILLLQLHEDLGPKEIAERLGLPAQQVRSQRARGIEKLKKILNPTP
ncbi:MAG: sigma-70 family RNA polymerase sigma factor [Candidatus Omnitrophica bacterium]|nr:sigma-70 family RNA polymerase sigma factor [Candidatus Omnitrophota bacterium]MCB9766776.1 sigma-70 family RNA polymerase sigma factor [Candidatus Omnitrophota bacterium]